MMAGEPHRKWMALARRSALSSTCLRRSVGAVFVKDGQALTQGWNGAPGSAPKASEVGCLRDLLNIPSGQQLEVCRGVHAEQLAVAEAAAKGVALAGATLYSTHRPCSICAKLLISVGIRAVIYEDEYPDPLAVQLFAEAGLPVISIEEAVQGGLGKQDERFEDKERRLAALEQPASDA